MFFKIGVIKSFTIFTGKDLSWSLFLIKFQVFKVQNRCFSVKFANFLRITVLKSISERLFPRILQEKLLNSIVMTLSIWAMSFISHTRRLYQDLSQKKENLYWSISFILVCKLFFPNWWDTYTNYFRVTQNLLCHCLLFKSTIMESSRHCIN